MPGKKRDYFLKQYFSGKIRVAEFAITNRCTAKCGFCSIWKQPEKVTISLEQGIRAIDKLYELGAAHITLTGGEPLLNPAVFGIIKHCTSKKIHTLVLNADARLLNKNNLTALKEAQADILCISMDSDDAGVAEASRKIPGLLGHIEKGVRMAKNMGIRTMASVLIWKNNHDKLELLFEKAIGMGFDYISVNYPEISESETYTLGGEDVQLSPVQITQALLKVIELKKNPKYRILNTVSSMKNIINFLDRPAMAKFHCYGGSKVLFVDWFFDVYPCMHIREKLGSLWELSNEDFVMKKCNRCNMSWYRDFSIYFHGLKSLRPIFETAMMFNTISLPAAVPAERISDTSADIPWD